MTNHLYYGDNLKVLREQIADGSVDLIYLDPPFNSNASYNVLFRSPTGDQSAAQIEAFDDTWHWGDEAEAAFQEVRRSGHTDAATMLEAMRSFLGMNDMMAYLAMMAVRLVELHRALKPTGSLYLHCDPTASHYLKILLDAVFGKDAYKNEVIWRRTGSHNSTKRFGPIHDVIHFVTKSNKYLFRRQTRPYMRGHVEKAFVKEGERYRTNYSGNILTGSGTRNGLSGRPWKGFDPTAKGRHWALPSKLLEGIEHEFEGLNQTECFDKLYEMGAITIQEGDEWPRYQRYITDRDGQYLSDIWAYQPYTEGTVFGTDAGIDDDVRWMGSKDGDRLGYPTQKPVTLLERILNASSNPGDVVLDPFCGCGTTVHAAEKLGRQWIGIDVTHLAIGLIEKRLRDAFPAVAYKLHGVPADIDGARRFFADDDQTKKEFEKWAVSLIGAQPWRAGKKGADGGIDGILPFGTTEKAVVSVKGGKDRQRNHIDQLKAVVDRERAQIGVFLTLEEPTKPMLAEAAGAGQYVAEGYENAVPKIQIVTIEEAMKLRDRAVQVPLRRADVFRKAAREEARGAQGSLDL
jgi:site-specific DNA-methyltransferase (adenine-specific)